MRKVYIIVFSLIFCTLSKAQNIDQSVVVNNDYIVQFSDFQRENIKPTLTDSLYKFDYDFDYSVFDSPYKGAFDFSPYQVSIVPGALPFDGKNLYLRAGAGVSLYPELDFAYIPASGQKFKLIITDNGRGHYGAFGATPNTRGNYDSTLGYYFLNDLNAKLLASFDKSNLDFSFLVGNRYAKTSSSFTDLNMLGADVTYASNSKSKIDYSIRVIYKYGFIKHPSLSKNRGTFSAVGYVNPLKIGVHRIALNAFYKVNGPSFIVALNPSYKIVNDQYSLSLGAKFDYSFYPPSATNVTITPKVDYKLVVLKDKLNVYGNISGGQGLYSAFSTVMTSPLYENLPFDSFYKELIAVKAGIDGQIFKYLDYKFEAAYSMLRDSPIETLRSITFQSMNVFYAQANISWKSKRFFFDSEFRLNWGKNVGTASDGYCPSKYLGMIDAKYNWLNRIFAGISLQGASSRKNISGVYSDIPGFIDLGFNGEYKYSNKMSFWLNSGNLLAMPIEKIPGIIEKSPYITLGLTLVL